MLPSERIAQERIWHLNNEREQLLSNPKHCRRMQIFNLAQAVNGADQLTPSEIGDVVLRTLLRRMNNAAEQ